MDQGLLFDVGLEGGDDALYGVYAVYIVMRGDIESAGVLLFVGGVPAGGWVDDGAKLDATTVELAGAGESLWAAAEER